MMARAKPERAARSSIKLASDPALSGITSSYFTSSGKPGKWPKDVLDNAMRGRLWTAAQELLTLPAQDDAVDSRNRTL